MTATPSPQQAVAAVHRLAESAQDNGDPAELVVSEVATILAALAPQAVSEPPAGVAVAKLPDVSELLVWAVEDDLLRMSKIMDADLQDALVAYSRRILALAATHQAAEPPVHEDTVMLDWLEKESGEDVDVDNAQIWASWPAKYDRLREAIRAARGLPREDHV